jgi:uncharacterized lipoprotein YmbA
MNRAFAPAALALPLLLALACLSGCAGSPSASFYTLSAQPPAASVTSGTSVPSVRSVTSAITISAMTVPEMVDRPQLALRVNSGEVKFDEFARWADPLKSQIRRVLAADLALIFPDAFVTGNTGTVDSTPGYLVSVDIQSFESSPGDAASIAALWSVRTQKSAVVSGRSVVREPAGGPGYDALVAAQSRALATVSHDIAVAIGGMAAR